MSAEKHVQRSWKERETTLRFSRNGVRDWTRRIRRIRRVLLPHSTKSSKYRLPPSPPVSTFRNRAQNPSTHLPSSLSLALRPPLLPSPSHLLRHPHGSLHQTSPLPLGNLPSPNLRFQIQTRRSPAPLIPTTRQSRRGTQTLDGTDVGSGGVGCC